MAENIILNNVVNLQDTTTAANTINTNSSTIKTAFLDVLSLTGQQPNQMQSTLDMNSNHVVNLPAPVNGSEPLRLTDASTLNGGGTIPTLPLGGLTGQALIKNSNANFDTKWAAGLVNSVGLALPADFTVTNSPVTSSGTLTGSWTTTPTGTGAVVRATSPILVTPILGTPTSGTLTNCTIPNLTGDVTSSGANSTTISSSAVTNAKMANMAAYTLKGNATSSSAAPTDISIPALTQKVSPAAGDFLLIADSAASNALKYATVSSVSSAGSVGSLNGLTGALSIAGSTGISASAGGSTVTVSQSLSNATTNVTGLSQTTTSTSAVMGGFGANIHLTPTYSGRVHITVSGFTANNTASDAGNFVLRYGTGTAPVNGAAVTGTALSSSISSGGGAGNTNVSFPFSVSGIATGLTPGTAYWFDLSISAVVGGTFTVNASSSCAFEF